MCLCMIWPKVLYCVSYIYIHFPVFVSFLIHFISCSCYMRRCCSTMPFIPLWYGGPEGQNTTTFHNVILQNTTIFQETTGNGNCVYRNVVKCCVLTFWATVSERKTQHFTKQQYIRERQETEGPVYCNFFFQKCFMFTFYETLLFFLPWGPPYSGDQCNHKNGTVI